MSKASNGKATVFSTKKLPLYNLACRRYRTAGLIMLVALMAFILFGGSILVLSLKNGLTCVEERFGADLIVVPEGNTSAVEGILLKGEPDCFYFNASYAEQIADLEGVDKVSSQFYLTSTGSSCCEIPVQIIGFEPETDFSVQPWIREVYSGKLEEGALIVGSDIKINNSKTLRFFNREYQIAAQLEETGTGLDNAVFTTMSTIHTIMNASKEQGFSFLSDSPPDKVVSSVLVKVADGYHVDEVKDRINRELKEIQIVSTQSILLDIADNLNSFKGLLFLSAGVFFILSIIMLGIVFSVSANERKKEFAILRIMGLTRKRLMGLMLLEAFLISLIGGFLGTILAAVSVFPFSIAIGKRLEFPYLQPSILQIIGVLFVSLMITLTMGPCAAAYSSWRISNWETGLLLKEGE